MLCDIETGEIWSGEVIDSLRHPLNIETLWSAPELAAIGLKIYVPPAPTPPALTADNVRAEAQRRIIELMGARDLEHCLIKQLNANMRANQLNDKRVSGVALTAEEDAEATLLRNMAAAIQSLRAKSNILEAQSPIPADYADDSWWV